VVAVSLAQRKDPSDDMTTDQFIRWPGDGTGQRYELVDGQLRAMAPPSSTHGLIQMTVGAMIREHLKASGLPCVVTANPPVIPRVGAQNNVRSPDLGVSCAKTATEGYALDQPVLLIEILSPSNRAETWSNVWTYTTIPSVQQILVIDSTKIEAKLLTRQADGTWPDVPEVRAAGAIVAVTCIGFEPACDAFYENVSFPA
jgi:Uma2 family endonuclease